MASTLVHKSFYPTVDRVVLGQRSVYVVTYANGIPVACGAFRPFNEPTAEVRCMYVAREHRRQGTARAVRARLEQAAMRLGYGRFVLATGCKQVPTMRLYESWGFQRIAAFGAYALDLTSVCYERTLSVRRCEASAVR